MLEWLKSMWAKYKVHVSVVGGALVVATIYGQCTFEPNLEAVEEAVEAEAETTPTAAEVDGDNAATTENGVNDGSTTDDATSINTENAEAAEATTAEDNAGNE